MKHNARAIDVRTRIIYSALAIMTIMFSLGKDLMAQTNTSTVVKNIVLVHGGLVDGSGWEGRLQSPEEGGLHGHDCPESDHLASRRRGGHEARDRRAEWLGDPRRSLIW